MECKLFFYPVVFFTHYFRCLRKLFADSMLTSPEEQSSSSPPHSQYQQDLKFLTYSASEDPDMTMGSSILAMAAESSGINLERDLEEELLSTPPRPDFDVDLDF